MPLMSEVKYDELLSNISVQFQPAQGGYLADKVAPPVPVKKESAVYWVYDKSRFDIPDSIRAPRSAYNRVEWTASTASYACEEYGLELPIDDRERDNAAGPIDLEVDSTEIVTDMVLNNREKRVADIVTSTSSIAQNTTLSGTSQWNDYTNGVSDPLDDARVARQTIFDSTGYRPNSMLLGWKVFEALKMHPLILERIQFSERAIVTAQILAQLFEVDELLVGGVLRRTSIEGATDALADVWGRDAVMFYSEKRPSLKRASFMYQFRNRNLRAFRYRDEEIASDVIRVTEIQTEHLVAASLGYLIKDAISA